MLWSWCLFTDVEQRLRQGHWGHSKDPFAGASTLMTEQMEIPLTKERRETFSNKRGQPRHQERGGRCLGPCQRSYIWNNFRISRRKWPVESWEVFPPLLSLQELHSTAMSEVQSFVLTALGHLSYCIEKISNQPRKVNVQSICRKVTDGRERQPS